MTVQEWFEGDKIMKADVAAIGEESDYYEKASDFIIENWERDADTLSVNQSAWAGKILDDMVERRITNQRRARF